MKKFLQRHWPLLVILLGLAVSIAASVAMTEDSNREESRPARIVLLRAPVARPIPAPVVAPIPVPVPPIPAPEKPAKRFPVNPGPEVRVLPLAPPETCPQPPAGLMSCPDHPSTTPSPRHVKSFRPLRRLFSR